MLINGKNENNQKKDKVSINIKDKMQDYCFNCTTKPCQRGCPLENNIPGFIHEKDLKKAYEILCETTVLPSICGRICPHSKQCQAKCVRGINGTPVSIGEVEKEIGDVALKNNYKIPMKNKEQTNFENKEENSAQALNKKEENIKTDFNKNLKQNVNKTLKVAVIGGGPAGLTCAGFLAKNGVKVTIYEKDNKLGGLLVHGIPEFRLPKKIVDDTIKQILDLGIEVKLNNRLGKDIHIEDLKKEYDAIFISIGANISSKTNIIGENLEGVYGANNLLENQNHPNYHNKSVAILGGGNVAMDTARTVKHMGAKEVTVIYRRAEEQMPAEIKEIADAKNEGIKFMFLTNIVKILGTNKIEKIECIKTKLVQKEGEKRLSPIEIENSNFEMKMDYVITAIGSHAESKDITELEKDSKGYIKVNENNETSIENVYAGGDIIGTKQTVAWAAKSGRNAASNIIKGFLL